MCFTPKSLGSIFYGSSKPCIEYRITDFLNVYDTDSTIIFILSLCKYKQAFKFTTSLWGDEY